MRLFATLPLWLILMGTAPVVAGEEPAATEDPAPLFAEDAEAAPAEREDNARPAEEAEPAGEAEPEPEPTPEDLAARVAALNRELRQAENELRQVRGQQPRRGAGDLEGIVLPANPTREDCERFVAELEEATEGQNSFSSADPQVDMLRQVPVEHIDLLVGASSGRSPLRFYAQYAMREMDVSALRGRIGALVGQQPAMIGIVVSQGWSADARDAIAYKLNQAPSDLGLAWFQAACELKDPDLYEAIHHCAVQSRYFAQVVPMLEGLRGYDLQRTVGDIWRACKDGNSNINSYQVATVAVRYGYVDALEELINQLNQRNGYFNNNGENTLDAQRTTVMRYIDFTGNNEEIARWFTAHKDELVFDHVAERFLLPEQLEQF